MRSVLALAAALVAAGSLSAQTVFPKGYDKVEGNSYHWHLSYPESNFQQIYYGSLGTPVAGIKRLMMRRDAVATGGAKRTLTCKLLVGHGKTSGWSRTYANNYVGSPTTVFSGALNLPDKTKVPGTGPQPFDFGIVFTQPFNYDGKNAFVWQLIVSKSTIASYSRYPNDRAYTTTYVYGSAKSIGTGCKTDTSGASTFTQYGYSRTSASKMELYFSTYRAPKGEAVTTMLGMKDLNLSGLFCATIHTDALVAIPIGTASSSGYIPTKYIDAGPWKPIYKGVKVYTQAVAIQKLPTPELKLSQGREITLPASMPGPAVKAVYVYRTGSGSSSGTVGGGPYSGGVVVQVSK